MTRLGVNIDHIAQVRQQRKGRYPDLLEAARVVQRCGAYGITVHLREDRRHVQEKDVWDIRKKVNIKLNLEMAATARMVRFALRVRPDSVCLVPEKRKELTTEGGLDVNKKKNALKATIKTFRKAGIRVSVFIDPVMRQVRAAGDVGAHDVELHTGTYAQKNNGLELRKLAVAARYAHEIGLGVNAGHGLDYSNIRPVLRLPYIEELNIGFSIVSRALFVGLEQAVKEMLRLLKK